MFQILLVTANRTDRNLVLRTAAREADFRFEVAEALSEVRDVLSDKRPDLLLLDPATTFFDGPDLVQAIQEQHPQTPVVLITSRGKEAVSIRAFRNGASNYVPKHLIAGELVPTLRSVLLVSQQTQRRIKMLERMTDFHCSFELESDRGLIATLVSYLTCKNIRRGSFPAATRNLFALESPWTKPSPTLFTTVIWN